MAQPSTPQQGSSVGAVGAPQAQALFRFRGLGGLAVNLRSLTSQAISQKLITHTHTPSSWLLGCFYLSLCPVQLLRQAQAHDRLWLKVYCKGDGRSC